MAAIESQDMPIRAAPFAHQRAAYQAALDEMVGEPRLLLKPDGESLREKGTGFCLLMEMGTGKTITSIAIAGRLFLDGRIKRVLIAAPKSIVGVWDDEFAKFADFDYNLAVLTGSKARRLDTLRHLTGAALQIATINYEGAKLIPNEIIAWLKAAKGESLMICDEGHKIKSRKSMTTKTIWKIGAVTGYRLLLTGTLITCKPLDVYCQYRFVNPDIFGASYYRWLEDYFYQSGQFESDYKLKRETEEAFTEKLHSIAFRATKAECLDLPEITDIVQSVELEDDAARIYQNLVRDSYTKLAKGGEVSATNILTQLLRLCQLTGGFLGGDDAPGPQSVSTAKLDALEGIVETAQENGEKLVIIVRFKAEIAAIKKMLDKKKIQYSVISGETKDRPEQVSRFQTESKVTVFIGQINTAGLGITLTAASTLVFYSFDYNMANFEQAKARVHRVGQTKPVTYIYLTAKGTIDEKILKALHNKADLAKSLIDDYRRGANPFA